MCWKTVVLLRHACSRQEVKHWKCLFVYLSGGECGRAAVSSVVLAVGPVVGGVAPTIPSKGLHTSYKQETVLWTKKNDLSSKLCFFTQHSMKCILLEIRFFFFLVSRPICNYTFCVSEQMPMTQNKHLCSKSNLRCAFSHSRVSFVLTCHFEWFIKHWVHTDSHYFTVGYTKTFQKRDN